MTIELKDVLHYYLGCEAVLYKKFEPPCKSIFDVEDLMNYMHLPRQEFQKIINIMPILWPIESITDKQARIIFDLEDALIITKETGKHHLNFIMENHVFIYMIKEHIDLFGLIESRQAFDASKFDINTLKL